MTGKGNGELSGPSRIGKSYWIGEFLLNLDVPIMFVNSGESRASRASQITLPSYKYAEHMEPPRVIRVNAPERASTKDVAQTLFRQIEQRTDIGEIEQTCRPMTSQDWVCLLRKLVHLHDIRMLIIDTAEEDLDV